MVDSSNYSGNPLESDLDFVRDKVGDVISGAWLLTDAEIEAEIAVCGSPIIAAVRCARKIAGRFSRRISKSIAGSSVNYSDLAKQYFVLAESLEQEALSGTAIASAPFSGSADQDAIFRRDLHTMPGCETDDGKLPSP